MPEVRDSSAAIREGFRHLDAGESQHVVRNTCQCVEDRATFLGGPVSHPDEASCGDEFRRVTGWKLFLLLPRALLSPKATRRFDQSREIDQPFLSVLPREVDRIDQSERARCVHGQVPPIKASKCRRRKTGSASTNVGPVGRTFFRQTGIGSGGGRTRDTPNSASVERPQSSTTLCSRSHLSGVARFRTSHFHLSWTRCCSQRTCVPREGAPQQPIRDDDRPLKAVVRQRKRSPLAVLSEAWAPQEVVEIGRMGRLTALKKPNGRIRGIVSGAMVRRLVVEDHRPASQQSG